MAVSLFEMLYRNKCYNISTKLRSLSMRLGNALGWKLGESTWFRYQPKRSNFSARQRLPAFAAVIATFGTRAPHAALDTRRPDTVYCASPPACDAPAPSC